MAPIAKENDIVTATPEAAVRTGAAASTGSEAGKVQPVALEIAVAVNGARAVEGSEKREPFSEVTKTVLVFGNGAVIRLQSPVAPGQLLFLTNEKTKKEVVCQVVKSKNYRNVSGYVELEFTESVVGFWGMRFPGDRIGSQSAAPPAGPASPKEIPASVARPAAPIGKVEPPTAAAPVTAKPDATANFNALKSILSERTTEASRVADVKPAAVSSSPVEQAPVKSAPLSASDPATEQLKQQTARLQEQLSSMLFTESPSSTSSKTSSKAPEAKSPLQDLTGTAAKILDFAKPPAVQPQAAAFPSKPSVSSASEEVKIPSWLEPLARNAANPPVVNPPVSTEDVTKLPPQVLEPLLEEHIAPEPSSNPLPLNIEDDVAAPSFGGGLLEESSSKPGEGGSKKGLMIAAIAAAALVVAGVGVWFLRNQGAVAGSTPATSTVAASTIGSAGSLGSKENASVSNYAPEKSPTINLPPAGGNSQPVAASTPSKPESVLAVSNGSSKTAAKNAQPTASAPTTAEHVAVEPEPKKPSLGQVKLAAPVVNRKNKAQLNTDADPGLTMSNDVVGADALSGVISTNTSQPKAPVAPVPVGGDVKPAKLVSSVNPVYPALARAQHVGGDVKIDALIDANGRVTTMKVVSGPTLLHQAAMDSLRQWKYQPATLDGKAVPMHLTVTIQFRLQ